MPLAVQRFDRGTAGGKPSTWKISRRCFGLYPQDKIPHRSYANIAAVLWPRPEEAGTYEFFRRLVFSGAYGNADMHLNG